MKKLFLVFGLFAISAFAENLDSLSVNLNGTTYGCVGTPGGGNVVKYCECVRNGGPDLTQVAVNPSTGAVLWKAVLRGWNPTNPESVAWDQCYTALEKHPACR